MPKRSSKRDLELRMPACVPQAKLAKHTTAGKAGSPCAAAGKAKSPHKLAKSSDTAGKAGSPCTVVGKAKSPHKLAKSSNTAAGNAGSPCTAASKAKSPRKSAKPSDTAAGINIPASETPFGIKDAVLRELIGLGKVQVVTRSSKLSRSGK